MLLIIQRLYSPVLLSSLDFSMPLLPSMHDLDVGITAKQSAGPESDELTLTL